MSEKKKFGLDDAYALQTPADNIRLYDAWAKTYDADFVESVGYVYFLRVVEIFLRQRSLIHGPVLDVGCGTGVVGVSLRQGGIESVDGRHPPLNLRRRGTSQPLFGRSSSKAVQRPTGTARDQVCAA